MAAPRRSDEGTDRSGFWRFVCRLAGAVGLTVALLLSFALSWGAFWDVLLGFAWMFTVGLFVVVPALSEPAADTLKLFPLASPPLPLPVTEPAAPIAQSATDPVADAVRRGAPSDPDWRRFLADLAGGLDCVLDTAFRAAPTSDGVELRAGNLVRRVELLEILGPPPFGSAGRAARACLKMMDEAQAFVMRVSDRPWPLRPQGARRLSHVVTRPSVAAEGDLVSAAWVDPHGVVLALPDLRLEQRRAEVVSEAS